MQVARLPKTMSTTITKETEEIKEDTPKDATDDVGVNKSDRNEGENIENDENTHTAEQDEKSTDENLGNDVDEEDEEEGDRQVVLTPSRRIRISLLVTVANASGPGTMTEVSLRKSCY